MVVLLGKRVRGNDDTTITTESIGGARRLRLTRSNEKKVQVAVKRGAGRVRRESMGRSSASG